MKLQEGAAAAATTSLTTKVQVVYQLCREGKLEHPHMIDVQYPTHQNGLRLRDVKKRLNKLRGKGMSESFAWSYKRSYKNAYIWRDLTEKDVILPLQGSKEYVLKASELRLDAYQEKVEHDDDDEDEDDDEQQQQLQLAHHHDHQHQSSTLKPSKLIAGLVSNPSLTQQKMTVNPHVKKQSSSIGSSNRNVELNQKMLDSLKATTHMCSSRKHDSYASGCCKSSSSQHSSECENSIKDNTQRKTSSHIIAEAAAEHVTAREKPAGLCLPSCDRGSGFSPLQEETKELVEASSLACEFALATSAAATEIPMKMRINWKREVPGKRIFFRGNNRSRVSNSEISHVSEVQVERKKSQFHHSQTTTHEVDVGSIVIDSKKPQQPCFLEEHCYPSFALENVGCDNLFAVQAQNEVHLEQLPPSCLNLRSVWARWCKGLRVTKSSSGTMGKESKPSKPMISNGHTFEESKIKSISQSQNLEEAETMTLAHQEVLVTTTGVESEACTKLGATNCSVKQQSPVSTSDDNQHNLMVSGVQDSHEALPAAPQPLSRSTSTARTTMASSGRRIKAVKSNNHGSRIVHCSSSSSSSESNIIPSWSQESQVVHQSKKCFQNMDERPLIPGLTKHNWEKMLQQALCNSLPPPDFEKLLKKCLHCGRTFKPDSLIVHKRGCHSLQKSSSHIATKTSHGGTFGRHSLQAY